MADSSSSDSDVEEYSGMEQPPLLKQIRTILDEYPDDGQIIKELVQNADDAGATRMNILYDGRTINKATADGTIEKKYRKFLRAPAMIFYNNAEFTQQDWRGIKMVYNSVKLDDLLQIGRFGLGFKSVFHITDYPCIISGENILFINPHERKSGRVCVTIKLNKLSKCKRLDVRDCLASLSGTFGFNEDTLNTGIYKGTLFWFPLRSVPTELSENVYSESKVMDLFNAFMSESERSLLFLKSLQQVKLYVNVPEPGHLVGVNRGKENSTMEGINLGQNTEFFSVEIDNENGTLLQSRRAFMSELNKLKKKVPDQSLHCHFYVTVMTKRSRKSAKDEISKSRWLIVNYLKGGEMSDRLKGLVQDETLSYHPLVGIAAPIHENGVYNSTNGHVFCFQPLPQEQSSLTGLPVHVNAFFALSQNRRHVKWPSDDQVRFQMHIDKAVDWNLALVSEVLPEAYVKLHECMVELSQIKSNPKHLVLAAYSVIPDLRLVNDRWKALAEEFIKLVTTKQMLFTENMGGKWLHIREAVVTLSDAHLNVDEKRCMDSVTAILKADKMNLAQIPDSVLVAVKHANCAVIEVSPIRFAQHLNQSDTYKKLMPEGKENILEYLCSDAKLSHIADLELLPLQNGTFTSFNNGPIIFLERLDVVALFPGKEEMFVSTSIRERSYTLLSTLIQKGSYQIRNIDSDFVVDLIKRTIEYNFGNVNVVKVGTAQNTEWRKWITGIWEYIEKTFVREVSKFCDLPLFPVTSKAKWNNAKSFQLHPLSDLLLLKKHDSTKLNNDVCKSFEHLSVTLVQHIPEVIKPDLVQSYLHDGSSESIMRVLERIDDSSINVYNEQSTHTQRDAFTLFLSSKLNCDLTERAQQLLCKLLLFKEYTAIESEPRWVSLDKNGLVFDESEFPIRFPRSTLRTNSSRKKLFAMNLGGKPYTQSEMVLDTMRQIDTYTQYEVKLFMYWFLKKRLYLENTEAIELAKHVRFLEAEDNQMHKANEMFDLSDILVLNLFRGENVLPSDVLLHAGKEEYLPGLRSLGLKRREDITVADIETTCRIIHEMSTGARNLDKLKAKALLELLSGNLPLLRQCHLVDLRCILVEQERIESYPANLPFYNKDAGISLCVPSELRSSEYANLIGSAAPVIDCQPIRGIAEHFGWLAAPEVSSVVRHMSVVIETYKSEHKSSLLPVITHIYEWLSDSKRCNIVEVKSTLENLLGTQNIGYIWSGDGFVSTDQVFVECSTNDIDLRPFFNIIPAELQHLKYFFIDLGCVRTITMDTYIETIERIKNTSLQIPTSKMRQMVINVLTKLKDDFSSSVLESDKTIYIPIHTGDDKTLTMRPAKQCTYCDAQWLKDVDYVEADDGIIYVHGDVSNATAEALGVPSLTQQVLSDADALEGWGQKEPLTRRLNSILKEGYVDGFSVPKELFQNADDAGASKLWILYDERENMDAREKLLSDGMAECQGPALWVYNDAEFTDEDLENITRLNGATKEADCSKIGKFGLGFCAVYNITDVPSFVSGESVVIFDPHTTFLGKALPAGNSPGLKLDLRKMKNLRMMRKISNQFKPYENVFGCKIMAASEPYFKGTLFRFPLRTKCSEISDVVYTPAEVKGLLNKIVDMSANMLIFNQNVTDLRLFHLPQNESDPSKLTLLFKVNKTAQRLLDIDSRFSYGHSLLKEATTRKQGMKLKNNPIRVIDEVTITTEHISYDMKENQTWLVSWATGTDCKSLELMDAESGALPLGAIAVPVLKTETDACNSYSPISISHLPQGFYTTSHLFFFMPLPLTHAFPFHINCPFAVSSDRRQLRATTEDDKSTRMKEWNESLLSDSAVMALLYMLENLSTLAVASKFYELWPEQEEAPLLRCVPESFYRHVLRSSSFRVFESCGSWYDISSCIFLDPELRKIHGVGDIAFSVLQLFSSDKHDKIAIDIPEKYYKLLVQADISVIKQKTISSKELLINYFFPNLSLLGQDKGTVQCRNDLLKYAICQAIPEVDKWLKNTECIPTKPHEALHMPSQLIQEDSDVACLYAKSDGRFPTSGFDDIKASERLRNLGMRHNILEDNDVLERTRSLEQLNRKCLTCALERCNHLLLYLSRNMSCHEKMIDDLRSIPFLPVMGKPKEWPFLWEADNSVYACRKDCKGKSCKAHRKDSVEQYSFERPSKLYHSTCQNLVGCLFLLLDKRASTCILPALASACRELLKRLGVNGIPSDSIDEMVVSTQLVTLASTYSSEKSMPRQILKDIYKHLNQLCRNEDSAAKVSEMLKSRCIVWVSDKFVLPSDVSFSQDCAPYLYGLRLQNTGMLHCDNLCKALAIQNVFQPKRIALLLQELFNQYGTEPLQKSDLDTSINLLTILHTNMKNAGIGKDILLDPEVMAIYAPDDHNRLQDTTKMCFNDYIPLPAGTTQIFVHEGVSIEVAKALGVKPKLLQNLEDTADDIVDFYQDEPLVTRLRGLLEGYRCDSGVFKELLQNADDAGATEIHFLNDTTTHGTNNLPDESMQPLQGPALCVFDNSGFTQKDLEGIQRLGKGSKSDDPSKTGQFGVGFNAVYNLTDTPSFLTRGDDIENGETMCLFDPMAKYVPQTKKDKPGKRYKNVNILRAQYSDVLEGYHEKHFFRDGSGTVFRFPLRNTVMAEKSEIKNDCINSDMIAEMLKELGDELPEMLVFLKNLNKVTISTYTNFTFVENYSVQLELSQVDDQKRREYFEHHKTLCLDFKTNRSSSFQQQQNIVDYEMSVIGKHQLMKKYLVVQSVGYKDMYSVPKIVKQNVDNGQLGLLPQGGVALLLSESGSLEQNTKTKKAKAFCFLPLPVETGLPVHVHGHFALDHETRRNLWKSDKETECHKTQWNLSLISNVIAPAYILLLNRMKLTLLGRYEMRDSPAAEIYAALNIFEDTFPSERTISDFYWRHLLKCVYQSLVNDNIAFLPIIQRNGSFSAQLSWTSLQIPGYLYQALHNPDTADENCLNNVLRNIGMRIVSVSAGIQKSMEVADVAIETLNQRHVIDYLCSYDKDMIDKCSVEIDCDVNRTTFGSVYNVQQVMQYCLQDDKYFLENILQIPLFVTQDGNLRKLETTKPIFVTLYNDLFPREFNDCFLHRCLISLLKYTKSSKNGLKVFTLNDFAFLLERSASGYLQNKSVIDWDQRKPPAAWIKRVWKFFWEQIPTSQHKDTVGKVGNDNLDLLSKWALLPVVENLLSAPKPRVHVVTVKEREFILDLDSFNGKTKEALWKMCEARLNAACFYNSQHPKDEDVKVYLDMLKIIPNNKQPNRVLNCLYLNADKCSSQTATLKNEEGSAVLRYLTDNLDTILKTDPGKGFTTKMQIRKLPIFIAHYDKRVALSSYARVFIVPINVPKDGLENLSTHTSTVLLKDGLIEENMRKLLAITVLSFVDVYKDYIIPAEMHMDRSSFYRHVGFIMTLFQNKQLPNKEKDKLLSCLSDVAFVEVSTGRSKVKDLFNPNNKVFKAMCKKTELLPRELCQEDFIAFFRLLGLQDKVTMALFVRFATEIAEEGQQSGLSRDIILRSKLVVSQLINIPDTFLEEEAFDKINCIHFIVPRKAGDHLSQIHMQHNCSELICFADSVLHDQIDVCWTSTNILPNWACPQPHMYNGSETLKEKFIQKLKIRKRPMFETFVNHCKNVCNSLLQENTILKLKSDTAFASNVQQVMECVYKAIKEFNTNGEIDTGIVSQLETTPIIYFPEERVMLAAHCAVNNCQEHEEIPPYVKRSPQLYGQYFAEFVILGASKEPSCKTYARVLQTLKQHCGDSKLLPPEEHDTKLAILNLLTQLEKQCTANLGPQVSPLFLLNSDGLIQDAKHVVICDNMYLKRRLGSNAKVNFFVGFDKLKPMAPTQIREEEYIERLKKLPDQCRPVMLTEIVGEKIEASGFEQTSVRLSRDLMEFLHGKPFIGGIIRLAKHSLKMANFPWNTDIEIIVTSKMRDITVRQVLGMKTILTLRTFENGSFGPYQAVENTSEQKAFLIDETELCTLYFDTGKKDWLDDFKNGLAVHINKCVNSCLKDRELFLLLNIMNLRDRPEKIAEVLDQHNIVQNNMESEDTTPCPNPGTFVPLKLHPFLDNGYGLIHEHDYKFMAYELEDPAIEDKKMDAPPTYIFCKIIRQVEPISSFPIFQNYEVDVGEESFIIIPAYKLYKFIRKKGLSIDRDLVVFDKSRSADDTPSKEPKKTQPPAKEQEKSMKEVKKEIRDLLTEAWKKDEVARRHIVKRLMLKWHPDKNPDKIDFCTKVFQYIQHCLQQLKKGNKLKDDSDSEDVDSGKPSRRGRKEPQDDSKGDRKKGKRSRRKEGSKDSHNSGSHSSEENNSDDESWFNYFENMRRRREKYYRRTNPGFPGSDFYEDMEQGEEPYHYYQEAGRWQRQAKSDLKHARDSLSEMSDPSYNWVCYIYCKAAEKSLKAAWYAKDANKMAGIKNSHDLNVIAKGLGSPLPDLANQLTVLAGDHTRMMYPDAKAGQAIPVELYTQMCALQVRSLAEKIVDVVSSTYNC